MAQYIDKSAVVAEIERRLKTLNKDSDFNYLQIKELESLLSFLDTLEVKEPNEVKEYPKIRPIEWSKEDKQTLSFIIESLSEQLNDEPDEVEKELLCKEISFLNSLKPQPIYKWSREDDKLRLEITDYLEYQKEMEPAKKDTLNKWVAWIATLTPQLKQL